MNENRFVSPSSKAADAFFGFVASAAAITVTYPADTMTRQRQVLSPVKPSIRTWRSLYKGLCSALVTQPTYWACYWPLYSWATAQMQNNKKFDFGTGMVASFGAAGIASIATNPLWMIRQRMQTELLKGKNQGYKSLVREM